MRKIAIAGFGIEGRATYRFLKTREREVEIHIFDENPKISVPEGAILHTSLRIPGDMEVVYKAPGIPNKKLVRDNPETKISSLTNLFLATIQGKVIGITGTKGKSTTSSLIHQILLGGGYKSVLVGNIGIAAITKLDDDSPDTWYVYEMSSFQCELLDRSPHIAVITNLFNEHFDHHGSKESYWAAKKKITQFQNPEDFLVVSEGIELETRAKKIVVQKPDRKFETKLSGEHNQLNIALARTVGQILNIPEEKMDAVVADFNPLPVRLEKVGEFRGIAFYDDSLATIPEATLASIHALEVVHTLILGGFDRGISYEEFAKELAKTPVKNFIVFPDTGEKMVTRVRERNIKRVKTMEEAVKAAYAFGAGICLLSNASPSFNLFKDYKDKSAQYRSWIEKLA